MPRVAVITPTYNRGTNGLLEKTMLSVLGQTYTDFIYVVVDDGSTDNTPNVVDKYSGDRRVVYVRRERTAQQKFGASPASNYGIETLDRLPEVEFVAFLHSDDLYARTNLERRVDAIEREGSELGYCWMGRFKNGRPLTVIKEPQIEDAGNPRILASHLKNKRCVYFPYQTLMITTPLLKKAGGFDENIGFGEDRDFTIRVLEQTSGRLAHPYEILHYYRVHDDSVTGLYSRNNEIKSDGDYLFRKHGRTRKAAIVEAGKRILTRPHSFLPEDVKRHLRSARDSFNAINPDFEMDAFAAQIEFQTVQQ